MSRTGMFDIGTDDNSCYEMARRTEALFPERQHCFPRSERKYVVPRTVW